MLKSSNNEKRAWVAALLLGTLSLPLAGLAQTVENSETIVLEKFSVTGMKSFSDQAIEGKTPVSFSEIGKDRISDELSSQDIPLVLNTTPSVYATTDGGAAGDARVNIRGFNQRNVSILINGVPTNDIENGWLYWSNWDGLGDVTSTIQMQRGFSNVTLPTPSIGGTMNIITDPAGVKRGGSVKIESGIDNFLKGTVVLNTGMLREQFALTVGLVRKVGDGNPRGAWTDALGYYVGSTWIVNPSNRLELFAIGAPQQHGQRTFASNIAAYDTAYAKSLGYTDEQINSTSNGALRQGPVGAGQEYNQNYAPVSSSYAGQQYFWGGLHNRHDRNFINERANYFHKPQINLNWYSTLSDKLSLNSVVYYSGGRGGGSGTLSNGSSSAAFARYANASGIYGSNINWDGTIASNAGAVAANGSAKTAGRSLGILRNSVNNQDQFGAVSKLSYTPTDELKFTAGIDWRTAKIDHFREVRDLLGGSYYLPTATQASAFWADGTSRQLHLGDKVDYFNTNTVDWLGLFAQGQYDKGPVTLFAVAGYSSIDYSFLDHFRKDTSGKEFFLEKNGKKGTQFKGGVNYAVSKNFSVYANIGQISKVGNFDGVINDIVGAYVPTSGNEQIRSYEAGVRYVTSDRKFNVSANYYHTQWDNRTVSYVNTQPNPDEQYYLYGTDALYSGFEIEGAWAPNRIVRFDFAASIGDWTYRNDPVGQIFNADTLAIIRSGTAYLNGLKVGDSPQTQFAYAVTITPMPGVSVKLQGRSYNRFYAEFEPGSRFNPADRGQSWQIPRYSIYDLHVSYKLPLESERYSVTVFAHVLNLLDETYVSDATDESSFEAVGLALAPRHSAQRAEVFLGPPLSYNVGVTVKF